LSFTPAGGGGWTKFVRGALDAAQTVGDLIEVSKSALRLASGEGDLDDLVTLGITGAGLGAGALPGKGVGASSTPWRGNPVIQNGNSKAGWEHIESRHVTGTHTKKGGDLFPAGTTRSQIEEAVKEVVEKGVRTSDPSKRMQTFEKRIKVNGRRDRVRVIVDSANGNVITAFPVRSE